MSPLDSALQRVVITMRDYHRELLAAPLTTFRGAERRAHEKLVQRPLEAFEGCPYTRPVLIARWLLQTDLMQEGMSASDANEIAVAATTPVTRGS